MEGNPFAGWKGSLSIESKSFIYEIRNLFGDKQADIRYHAMGVNAGMERLVKMMRIGTLSSMLVNNNQ